MKMIDMLKSTLLNGYFANGTLLTGLRWPITFLVGMGLKYSCKSILDKSHRCALAPLLNNIFGSIFFFFFYTALSWNSLSLPPVYMSAGRGARPALAIDRRETRSGLQRTRSVQCSQPQIRSRQFSYISRPIPRECKFMVDSLMLHLTILSFSTLLMDPT